jgi:hypothetical protein
MEEGRSTLKISTGKPGKRFLGRPRCIWDGNIRTDHKAMCINTRNWIDSAHDKDYWRALVNAIFNLQVPLAMELASYREK